MNLQSKVPALGTAAGEATGLESTIWDPLRVLVIDAVEYKVNHSKMVDFNNPATISVVILFNTGLDVKTVSRRDTVWPGYSQIRADQRGGGMMVQFDTSLKIEELTGLPSEIGGMWTVVRGEMVHEKEKISVVGVVADRKQNTEKEVMLYLSKCLVVVGDKYGTEVEMMVLVNKDLNEAYKIDPILALTFTRPAPGTYLLSSSSSLQSRPLCGGQTYYI